MLKLWTRLVMGLIFVFVTISSPMHAAAMGVMHDNKAVAASIPKTAMPEMAGMFDECAKAMAAKLTPGKINEKSKPAKAPMGHGNGCCTDGCTCPLSHCPATATPLAITGFAFLHIETANEPFTETHTLRSYLAETLKRPPRA